MKSRITELSCKEVINICDGTRYGFVNDVEVDCSCGRIVTLIIYPKTKILPFCSKKNDIVIRWEAIKRIGEDIILVEFTIETCFADHKTKFFAK